MATITINATLSNRMLSNQATTVFTDRYSAGAADSVPQIQRGLIKIPFTGLPPGSIINSVTLQVYNEGNAGTTVSTRTLRVYRMIRAWTAGCTWNTYDGSNSWGTVGAGNTSTDREATDIGSTSVAFNQALGYFTVSLTTAAINTMYLGSFTNNGLLLKFDTESNDQHDFGPTITNPAQWIIDYIPVGGGFLFNLL